MREMRGGGVGERVTGGDEGWGDGRELEGVDEKAIQDGRLKRGDKGREDGQEAGRSVGKGETEGSKARVSKCEGERSKQVEGLDGGRGQGEGEGDKARERTRMGGVVITRVRRCETSLGRGGPG